MKGGIKKMARGRPRKQEDDLDIEEVPEEENSEEDNSEEDSEEIIEERKPIKFPKKEKSIPSISPREYSLWLKNEQKRIEDELEEINFEERKRVFLKTAEQRIQTLESKLDKIATDFKYKLEKLEDNFKTLLEA